MSSTRMMTKFGLAGVVSAARSGASGGSSTAVRYMRRRCFFILVRVRVLLCYLEPPWVVVFHDLSTLNGRGGVDGFFAQDEGPGPSLKSSWPPLQMLLARSQGSTRGTRFHSTCWIRSFSPVPWEVITSRFPPRPKLISTFGNAGAVNTYKPQAGLYEYKPACTRTSQADIVPQSSFPGRPRGESS